MPVPAGKGRGILERHFFLVDSAGGRLHVVTNLFKAWGLA